MKEKLSIDRHFLFLHGERLAVFAERVLRDTQNSPYVPCDMRRWQALERSAASLRQVMRNPALKRRARTEAIREQEAIVLQALQQMADYIEVKASCKSDIFTTGFRPQSEQRQVQAELANTRRHQRISAKLERLVETA